jgi:hypothetical protein
MTHCKLTEAQNVVGFPLSVNRIVISFQLSVVSYRKVAILNNRCQNAFSMEKRPQLSANRKPITDNRQHSFDNRQRSQFSVIRYQLIGKLSADILDAKMPAQRKTARNFLLTDNRQPTTDNVPSFQFSVISYRKVVCRYIRRQNPRPTQNRLLLFDNR